MSNNFHSVTLARLWKNLKFSLYLNRSWRNWDGYNWTFSIMGGVFVGGILLTIFFASQSTNDFNNRLETEAKKTHYASGEQVWCNVIPHDWNNDRLWTSCTVVTSEPDYQYEVTYHDPHGNAPQTDTLRVLDMKKHL